MGTDEPGAKRLRVEGAEGAEGVEYVAVGEEQQAGGEVDAAQHQKTVNQLEALQRDLDKVNDEASDKVLAVEQDYNRKRRPIYAKRSEVISQVPHFWHRTLLGHAALAQTLTEEDLLVLEYCTEVDVQDYDDIKSGFSITLKFLNGCPFFKNTQLTKHYSYGETGHVRVQGTTPDYNEGFELFSQSSLLTWISEEGETTEVDRLSEWLKEEIWPNPLKFYMAEDEPEHPDYVDEEGGEYEDDDGEGGYLEEGEGDDGAGGGGGAMMGGYDEADLGEIEGEEEEDDGDEMVEGGGGGGGGEEGEPLGDEEYELAEGDDDDGGGGGGDEYEEGA